MDLVVLALGLPPGKASEAAALVLGTGSPGLATNIEVPSSKKVDLEGN